MFVILTIHLAEGYFNTYDLAKRDAKGNIQVTGRVDDAIRMQGVWLEVPKIETVMVRMIWAHFAYSQIAYSHFAY